MLFWLMRVAHVLRASVALNNRFPTTVNPIANFITIFRTGRESGPFRPSVNGEPARAVFSHHIEGRRCQSP